MRRVIVESPYKARWFWQRWLNRRYARRCLHDCLERGESPFASHLLYTQPGVLRDGDPVERDRGIRAGLAWGELADASVVYEDRGISAGMWFGIEAARTAGRPVEYRSLYSRPRTEGYQPRRVETTPGTPPSGGSSVRKPVNTQDVVLAWLKDDQK
jgi:hypothetical protein